MAAWLWAPGALLLTGTVWVPGVAPSCPRFLQESTACRANTVATTSSQDAGVALLESSEILAPTGSSEEPDFSIVLEKTGRVKTLGVVQLNVPGRSEIKIEAINIGLIHAWNQEALRNGWDEKVVKPGDRIIAVNNIRGSAEAMIVEITTERIMTLKVRRDPARQQKKMADFKTFMSALKPSAKELEMQQEPGSKATALTESKAKEVVSNEPRLSAEKDIARMEELAEQQAILEWQQKQALKKAMKTGKYGEVDPTVVVQKITDAYGTGMEPPKPEGAWEKLSALKKGQKLTGVVTKTFKGGFWVNVGVGKDGLVRSDLMWKRKIEPKDAVEEGDRLTVWVEKVKITRDQPPVFLLRQRPPVRLEPYLNYTVNEWILGNVSYVDPSGIYVWVPPPVDAVCELEWQQGKVLRGEVREWDRSKGPEFSPDPYDEGYRPGDQVPVRVVKVDLKKKLLDLSMIPF